VGRVVWAGLVVGLALTSALVQVQPAAATSGGSRVSATTPIPPWVTPVIDQPTPATGALAPALWWGRAGHGPVITVRQAETIFSAEWSLRFEAFQSQDPSVVGAFESGPALEADEVICKTCTALTFRGNITNSRVLVPDTSTFPATFLAEVLTTTNGAPYTQFLVISRQSASTPWTVVADPGEPGDVVLPQAQAKRHGSQPVPDSNRAAQLPAELAAYWQHWVYKGRAPEGTPFAAGRWTTAQGTKLAKAPPGSVTAFNGLIARYRYRGGTAGESWSFGVAGGTLTCGVVRYQTSWSALGGYDWQPPDQTNWGPNVAPGFYQDVVETQIAQPCFLEHAHHAIVVLFGGMNPETIQGLGPVSIPSGTPSGSQAA
jgi:hypothetical protein